MTHPTQSHDHAFTEPDELDVYGVGNALVDMEYKVDDAFLAEHGVAKGLMTLVEEDRLDALTDALSELCLLYTSPSPRDLSTSRMPSSA